MSITIEDISWNRVFLNVRYRATAGETLKLYRIKQETFIDLREQKREGDLVWAQLNLADAGHREPPEAGEWIFCRRLSEEEATLDWAVRKAPYLIRLARRRLWKELPKRRRRRAVEAEITFDTYPFADDEIDREIAHHPYDAHAVAYDKQLFGDLQSLSRVFRYFGGRYGVAASILPRTDATDFPFTVLAVDFFIKNYHPRIRRVSHVFFEKQCFIAFHKVMHLLFPKHGNRVLFLKTNGDEPTDNMAAIRDRMIERGLDGQFKIAERYRNTLGGRQNVFSWCRDIIQIAKSDYVFIDDYCPVFNFIDPGDKAILTQVWHAGVGFKSVGYARFGITGSPDPYQSAHRRYNYALIGNEHLRDIYSEVFGIEPEALLATGMPRLDHFLEADRGEEIRAELVERFPWMEEGRVVVFAPTFRGTGQKTAFYPYDTYIDMDALYQMCCETNTYFVFEMHHFIDDRPQIPVKYQDRIFDLSDENLSHLYFVADVLVTDYSSCFYDYLLLEKPVVFYVPDKDVYQATRGVQRTVDEMAPGVVCETFADFMQVLVNEAYADVQPDPSMIDRCLEQSGLASDRAIDTILLGRDVPGVKMG